MALHTIVYSSREAHEFSEQEIEALLVGARSHNSSVGITGILFYFGYVFFQVLEGPEEEVRDLYQRIAADPRHKDITLHVDEAAQGRLFGDWSMAYTVTDRETISQTDNVVQLFQQKSNHFSSAYVDAREAKLISMISLVAKTIAA